MNGETLRTMQAPLKEQYRVDIFQTLRNSPRIDVSLARDGR